MKRRDTEENREYWRSVEEIAEEVRSTFPLWKLPEDVAKDWSEYRANKKPDDKDGPGVCIGWVSSLLPVVPLV